MNTKKRTIGRTRMALVSGCDGCYKAILSTVTVRIKRCKKGQRLVFSGKVRFANASIVHIRDVILPIVDEILGELKVPRKTFEISVVNVGAASCRDLGMEISGSSADAPILLAMLSAALQVPLNGDFVATGHIASRHGDISAVRAIPAKISAAVANPSVKRFIYGDLQNDRSFDTLSPIEKETSLTAVLQFGEDLTMCAVRGIDELIGEVLGQEDIVLSSLQKGFFHIQRDSVDGGDPIGRALDFITNRNNERFWRLLQQHLITGKCEDAIYMLEAYARFFQRKRQYPSRFGESLLQLVCAVPPAVRRLKLSCPLLPFARCISLARFAEGNDAADVPLLFDAVRARVPGGGESSKVQASLPSSTQSEYSLFDTITAEISELVLTKKLSVPIDSARASFVLASSTVKSYDEFIKIVESFFVHLQNYTSANVSDVFNLQQAGSKAMALLEETFRKHGGCEAAYARARDGTDGGIRTVLDAITEHCKKQIQFDQVNVVLEQALADMDWPDRVSFTKGAMKRLGPFLSAETRNQPPERFAKHIDEIARAYVKSKGNIQQLLSTM